MRLPLNTDGTSLKVTQSAKHKLDRVKNIFPSSSNLCFSLAGCSWILFCTSGDLPVPVPFVHLPSVPSLHLSHPSAPSPHLHSPPAMERRPQSVSKGPRGPTNRSVQFVSTKTVDRINSNIKLSVWCSWKSCRLVSPPTGRACRGMWPPPDTNTAAHMHAVHYEVQRHVSKTLQFIM